MLRLVHTPRLFGAALSVALASRAAAQAKRTFAPDDALNINSYSVADLTDDGRYAVLTNTVRRDSYGQDFRRDGDPTYARGIPVTVAVVDTKSGAMQKVFADKKPVKALRLSPDGKRLAMLMYNGDVFEPALWDRATNRTTTSHLPAGKYVAENSDLRWTPDGKQLVIAVHTNEWRKKAHDVFTNMTVGPVFVQSSSDPFLSWDDVRRMGNVRSVATFDPATSQLHEIVPETMVGSYTLAEDGSAISYNQDIQKKTNYDSFNAEQSLRVRPMAGGAERTLFPTTNGVQVQWAEDGKHYAYAKDGRVFLASIDGGAAKQLLGAPEAKPGEKPDTSKAGRDAAAKQRFSVTRYSPAGDAIIASNRDGLWLVDVATGARDLIIATDSSETAPRYSVAAWSDDGKHVYLSSQSRTKWERGLSRWDRDTKTLKELVKDGRSYSGLRLSKDGNVALLSIADGNRPADVYVADGSLGGLRRLVETNPQLNQIAMGRTELINYLDADGHQKNAVVYYPANYEKGKAYPTIFEVYEDFFDDTFDVRGNVAAGHGYVFVHPSVDFDIGYPGEAWLKGVTAAANKLIEMGIADSARLALQGQSYGGYATNILVTQTNRFKAAVNISGKVDMISFYTDSPRLGVRNINAAEKTQDRLGATMWEQPQKYIAHSAILNADRIKTPMMLITGEQDSNVPADNTREMYYALRRLGKEVIWVNYMNGGHGGGTATVEDFLDMQKRMMEWYDTKLKPKSAKVASN